MGILRWLRRIGEEKVENTYWTNGKLKGLEELQQSLINLVNTTDEIESIILFGSLVRAKNKKKCYKPNDVDVYVKINKIVSLEIERKIKEAFNQAPKLANVDFQVQISDQDIIENEELNLVNVQGKDYIYIYRKGKGFI